MIIESSVNNVSEAMKVETSISSVRCLIRKYHQDGELIGLVPTMGYLHTGHRSLIEQARHQCDRVVVSIFVNPIQFGPKEDFSRYPRDLESDLQMCREAGVDLVFIPETGEMYPSPNNVYIDVRKLGDHLCGASRPGHFQGVLTVVAKLFNICQPDIAFFGEKDAQQLAIIRQMVHDLNFPIEILGCPIVREADGLALSSRNVYLSPLERQAALVLSRSLAGARLELERGERDAKRITAQIRTVIESEQLARVDYIKVVDSLDLQPVITITGSVLVAVAVYFNKTRLIDNFTFSPSKEA